MLHSYKFYFIWVYNVYLEKYLIFFGTLKYQKFLNFIKFKQLMLLLLMFCVIFLSGQNFIKLSKSKRIMHPFVLHFSLRICIHERALIVHITEVNSLWSPPNHVGSFEILVLKRSDHTITCMKLYKNMRNKYNNIWHDW